MLRHVRALLDNARAVAKTTLCARHSVCRRSVAEYLKEGSGFEESPLPGVPLSEAKEHLLRSCMYMIHKLQT